MMQAAPSLGFTVSDFARGRCGTIGGASDPPDCPCPVGMALLNGDGIWLRVNRSLCEMPGYSEPGSS